jgi:predicted sugar kinase
MQCFAAAAGEHGAALGQSSWGPTAFAIVPSADRAATLVRAAEAARAIDPALVLRIVRGRNHGALLTEGQVHGRGL